MAILPNLYVVGAMRSGTTSAYRYLSSHPDIFMSSPKEPTYLAFRDQLPHFSGPGDDQFVSNIVPDYDSYTRLFREGSSFRYRGEASATYMYLPAAPRAIGDLTPEAHCLVLLRDPVDRAWSSFQYQRSRGREPFSDFDQALAAEAQRIRRGWSPIWHYYRAGLYSNQLANLFSSVPRNHVSIVLYDTLVSVGASAFLPFLDILGLPHYHNFDADVRHNRSNVSRNTLLDRALASSAWKRALKRRLPGRLRSSISDAQRAREARRGRSAAARATIPDRTSGRLRELYRSDIVRVEALTGLDLSSWK